MGKGKAKQHKGHGKLLASVASACSLPTAIGKEALAQLNFGGREKPGDQSGGRTEREASYSPTPSQRTLFEPCDHQGLGPRQAE